MIRPNRRVVAMTAYNRPALLQQTLAALVTARTPDWDIRIKLEPSDLLDEIVDVIRAAFWGAGPGPETPHVELNERRLGPQRNPFEAIAGAFADSTVDVVLYVQDDCVLAPDAFELVDWWVDLPERDDTLCLWLLAYESPAAADPGLVFPTRGEQAIQRQECRFHSGGAFAISRAQWDTYFVPWWNSDGRGSDWAIGERMGEIPDLCALVPALSRCTHIGATGTFCTPAQQERIFSDVVMATGRGAAFHLGAL